MDVFSQRMTVISDHLQSAEFQQAIRELSDFKSKKKNMEKITEKQKVILCLIEAICYIKNYAYGEADQAYLEFIKLGKEFDGELKTYFKTFFHLTVHLSKRD